MERPRQQLDQVLRWEEAGFDPNSIGVYGTSVENLTQIVLTGEIQPFPREYLHPNYDGLKFLQHDDLLYYFKLIGPNLKLASPDVYQQVCDRFPGWNVDKIEPNISPESALASTKFFALDSALSDHFLASTGVRADSLTLYYIAQQLMEDAFERYHSEVGDHIAFALHEIGKQADQEEVEKVIKSVSKQETTSVLSEGFKRRGVLIFYNKQILNHRLLNFYEGEDELLIASKKPLRTDVISGIQLLSIADREMLFENEF